MKTVGKKQRNERRLWSAIAVVAATAAATTARAGTSGAPGQDPEVTISISGSTALKNFVTGQGFTFLIPGDSITLNNGGTLNTIQSTTDTGSIQLAPTTFTANEFQIDENDYNALRVEYHESGSVEGIYELANDQIGPISFVENSINRDPNGGNAVWVNGNQIGGVGAPNGNSLTIPHNDPGNNYLGAFYGATAGGTVGFGPGVQATFSLTGLNTSSVAGSAYTQAGQNAVQLAISDVVPIQAFTNVASGTAASQPWFSTPQNLNYGVGNTNLYTGGLGIAGGGVSLQPSSVLNMAAGATNPRTGGTFGVGPWNSAGLGNLNSETTAVSATLFVANPGTGLDRLNRTDAQWLQTTGRLANGAAFDMTTRDVNSGTHNVASLDIGIDPSWTVGLNDNGNGNANDGATTQINVGSAVVTGGLMKLNIGTMKFSNKTAGGAQLRPTVQDARMSVGTLSVGDANGVFATGNAYGLRALDYADGVAGSTASYVQISAYNIITGNYALYQNEQFVTLKAPQTDNFNFTSLSTSQWAQISTNGSVAFFNLNSPSGSTVPIQGDDSTGAVSQVVDNVQASEAQNFTSQGFQSSAFAYIQKGFILPDFMTVEKPQDGIGLSAPIAVGDATDETAFLKGSLTSNTTGSDPDSVTVHSGDVYGGKGSNTGSFAEGAIAQTAQNYLFGNFNQNGIRDFDAVVVQATSALAILENAEAANNGGTLTSSSVNSGLLNSTVIGTLGPVTINGITYTMPSALATMSNSNVSGTLGHVGATKGDLIMLGDFSGRGVFDGKSLLDMATGAAIADITSTFVTTNQNAGANDHLTLQSENISVLSPTFRSGNNSALQSNSYTAVTQETFGDAVRRGTLFKNAALDYLNNFTTPQMKIEAASVLYVAGTNAPSGSTDLGNVGGNEYFSYDPSGVNAFNKADANRDGTVDLNDAVLVDNNAGKDYTNLNDELSSTQQSPVTGAVTSLNLVMVKQVDASAANPSTVIGTSDLASINTSLSGSTSANWYGYNLQKTGSGTIVWGQTAGTVRVYSGASFQISGGSLNVGGGTVDPFSDNTGGATTGNHVAVALDHGGKLKISGAQRNITVAGLTINTASNSRVDVGNGGIAINYGTPANDPVASVAGYLKSGYNGGAWTGTAGIISTVAQTQGGPALSVGYADGNTDVGTPAGANQVLVKYTLAGDANLDGLVNFNDLVAVVQNFNKGGTDWAQGNFQYGTSTNFNDLVAVVQNFNKVLTFGSSSGGSLTVLPLTVSDAVQVPEPGVACIAFVAGAGLLARRSRRGEGKVTG
jgi:hypothetical protein